MGELLKPGQDWAVQHIDCIEHLHEMPDKSADMSVFSPPFPAVYSYSSSSADIGNSEDRQDSRLHLSFFFRQFARILKPGRVVVVHVQQIPRMKRAGEQGLHDFRGMIIRLAERAGLTYEYDWSVRKNPQSQALRGKAWELKFQGLETDRSGSRGALPDFLIKFRAPGDNKVKINTKGEVSRNDWIKWAEHCWDDVIETDTLNVAEGRGDEDVKHICVAQGSLVLTESGHKPIEQVDVGELVLTHKGRWRPVIAKRCNGVRRVVQVHAQGVPFLRVTPDHKIWTRSGVGLGRWPNSKLGTSHPRLNAMRAEPQWIEAQHTKASYINLPLPSIEESKWTAKEWWIVGRWLGDGHWDSCARPALHISCARKEKLQLVATLGDSAGGTYDNGESATQIRIKDRSGRLRELISKCGRGASGKNLPREALSLEPKLAKALLDGYMSADGHYVEKYKRLTASSVSRPLLLGMSLIAQRVYGVACSVYAGRQGGPQVILGRNVNTKDSWVLSAPPHNLHGFVFDDGAWKKVRKIEESGEDEVWDLQVEEDESFVVEGCAVHNCPLQLEVIRRLILLFTNPGEIVFSPFAGIGSEGFMALGGISPKTKKFIANPRRFYGCELKDEYHETALRNLARAQAMHAASKQKPLFGDDKVLETHSSTPQAAGAGYGD